MNHYEYIPNMDTDRAFMLFKIQLSNQVRIFKMVITKYTLTFYFVDRLPPYIL